MYKIIADEKELKWYYENILHPLENNEVYFVSLSARNKYLTAKEREDLQLGRTEMFARKIISIDKWEVFLRSIKSFEINEGGYTTKNNSNIPEKSMVCYFNINPSCSIKAYNMFNKTMNDYMFELAYCSIHDRAKENILKRINKQRTLLMNCYQKSRGTKHWLDLDFDVPEYFNAPKLMKDFLNALKIEYYWVETKSGYHLLIDIDSLSKMKVNPQNICQEGLIRLFRATTEKQRGSTPKYEGKNTIVIDSKKYEIIINKNAMIPLPGTYQAGHKVTVLNKEG